MKFMNLFTLTSTTTKTLLLRTPSPFTRPSTILIKRLSSNTSFSSSSISIKPRMRIHFTCTANTSTHHQLQPPQLCGHQNIHEFTKLAYERGIVLVECPNCHNRHLIADHLQWFTNNPTADDPNFSGNHRTIVDLMKAKGEKVRRGRTKEGEGEVVEVFDEDDDDNRKR